MKMHRRALVALMGVALLASACGGGDDDSTSSGSGGSTGGAEAPSGEHDPDGSLRIGFLLVPTTLDPHGERHIGDRYALHPIWDTLVRLGNDRSVEPNVATEWEFDEAGTTLTFTLRDDITFHDGTALTAEAAKLSIERVLSSEAVTASVKNSIADVESVESPDATTLVVTLSKPNAGVLPAFATMAGAVINPEYLDADLTVPPAEASSGPYVAVDLKPDASVTYERAPNVWNPDTGKLATFTVEAYGDSQAGLNALESDALDMAFGRVDLDVIEQVLARNPDLQFEQTPAGPGGILYLRNTRAPLDDQTFREAVMHALDNDTIAEHGIGRHCVATSQWVPEGVSGHVDGLDPFPYDPDKAKDLLEQSGVTDASFEVMVGADQAAEQRAAQIVQQNLGDVGISIEITPVATAEAPVRWYEGNTDAYFNAGSAFADTGTLLYQTYFGTANLFGPDAGEAVGVFEAALAPGDDREERLQEAHRAALESAIAMPICFQTSRWLADESVIGLADMPLTWTGIFDPSFLAVAG